MTDEQILKTEYSMRFDTLRYELIPKDNVDPHFDELRKNMMVLSFYKYGPMKDNYDKHKCMDAIGNIEKRLAKYLETGNTEFLADIANFAMIEFMYPSITGAKYTPTIANIELNSSVSVDSLVKTFLKIYESDKNTESLVIVANIVAKEFTSPMRADAKYVPTDSGACEVAGFGIKQMQDEMEEKSNRSFQRFL